jgi:hypothetical protein
VIPVRYDLILKFKNTYYLAEFKASENIRIF